MEKINLAYWYMIGSLIHPFIKLKDKIKDQDIKNKLIEEMKSFQEILGLLLIRNDELKAETISYNKALSLYGDIEEHKKLLENLENTEKKDLETIIETISKSISSFEEAYKNDLSIRPTFIVSPKGAYDTNILLNNPWALFPPLLKPEGEPETKARVPGIEKDVEEAAKCLAFDIPTAMAFHLFRILEGTILYYYNTFSNQDPQEEIEKIKQRKSSTDGSKNTTINKGKDKKQENTSMGFLIKLLKELKQNDPLEKKNKNIIIACLHQIKNLHRNPTSHYHEKGENNLTSEEGQELLGIIYSALSIMLRTADEHERNKTPPAEKK